MSYETRRFLLGGTAAAAATVFLLENFTPLGSAVIAAYLPLAMVAGQLAAVRGAMLAGVAGTLLITAGLFGPAPGHPAGRLVAAISLWATVGMLARRSPAQELELEERSKVEAVLREHKDRLDAVVTTAVEAIISMDAGGLIESFNPAAEKMFGYSADEVLGQNVAFLMPSPYREEHDRYVAHYLETGEKKIIGIGREVVGLRKDGSMFPIDLSVAEARLGDRRLFVGMIRDISARKQAEAELEASHRDLEKALAEVQARGDELRVMTQQLWHTAKLASVGELAASIAHELNNPLATVSLRIESALGRTAADDPRRRGLEIIQQETQRMSELVANLLQFSRRGREENSTVDVRQELMKAVELIQHHLRKRLITVHPELAAETPLLIADRQKLRQVFLNLLTNAGDAMPEGGTLILRTAPAMLESGKPAVLIEFTDTGVGIPAENLERIMEPFFTTKEEGRGTGLGLAICRRIVQEHYGSIQITSTVGRGTTVSLLLPLKNGTNVEHLRGNGFRLA